MNTNDKKILTNPVVCKDCPFLKIKSFFDTHWKKVQIFSCLKANIFIYKFIREELTNINYLPPECVFFLENTLDSYLVEVFSDDKDEAFIKEGMEKVKENLKEQGYIV